jgi:beta-lactamase class A
VLAAVLEVTQLVYPSSRLLPLVEVDGQRIGGQSTAAATAQLNTAYNNAQATVRTDTKSFDVSFEELGVSIAAKQSAQAAANYPLWQRLIPFSSVAIALTRDTPMQVHFIDEKVRAFAQKVQNEGQSAAVNASITIKDGKATLVPATPSKAYPADTVIAAIKKGAFAPKTRIAVAPRTTPAALTDREVEAQLEEVQRLLDDRLVLTLQGEETKVDRKDSGSWLTFAPSADSSRLDIGLGPDRLEKYLEGVQSPVYKAPGTTNVQQIDDREVSRTTGASGRGVDMEKARVAIDRAIKNPGEDTVGLSVTDLSPVLAYDKKYSNTDKELAALLTGIAAAKGGYGISLMELDGRSAYANGNKQFVAASTYKLYVAYAVFEEIKAGRMSWTDVISGGRTAAKCFDDMIVISDNDCPKAFGNLIGWSKITALMHGLGLSSATRLGFSMYTTSNDLAYFLYRIQNGSILSSGDKERLIDAMKRQRYTRAGIPAGVGGTVADKVGDVDGYLHDAAIVYGSKKTYVLILMSYGGSWTGIADAARQIHAAVNR